MNVQLLKTRFSYAQQTRAVPNNQPPPPTPITFVIPEYWSRVGATKQR